MIWFSQKNDSKTEWSWKLEIRNGISPFDVDESASGDTLSALNHILNVQTRIIFYSLAKWTEICEINLFSCDMSRHNEVKVSNGIGFWAHVIILHLKIRLDNKWTSSFKSEKHCNNDNFRNMLFFSSLSLLNIIHSVSWSSKSSF